VAFKREEGVQLGAIGPIGLRPTLIRFHSKRPHSTTKMNDNINMNSTIAGSMNDNINMNSTIAGSMNDNINMNSTIAGSMNARN
jgi:hypothetical protein